MYYLVGLGNPGTQYKKNRHNTGNILLDLLDSQLSSRFNLIKSEKTYMNDSGKFVNHLLRKKKLATNNLVIIHDDLDIAVGNFKLQFGRGSAGHKGVQSIIDYLGTKSFWRLRVGIGCDQPEVSVQEESYVLENLTKKEIELIKSSLPQVIQALENLPS